VARKNFDRDGTGKKTKKWTGYMVGVMVCAHEVDPKSFAAMSGIRPLPDFVEIAGDVVDVVLGDGEEGGPPCEVDQNALIGATSAVPPVDPARLAAAVAERWEETAARVAPSMPQSLAFAPAQHLIRRAITQRRKMTEMFFAPVGPRHFNTPSDWRRARASGIWTPSRTDPGNTVGPECRVM